MMATKTVVHVADAAAERTTLNDAIQHSLQPSN